MANLTHPLPLLVFFLMAVLHIGWCGITEFSSRSEDTWDPDAYTPNDNTIMANNVIIVKKKYIPGKFTMSV